MKVLTTKIHQSSELPIQWPLAHPSILLSIQLFTCHSTNPSAHPPTALDYHSWYQPASTPSSCLFVYQYNTRLLHPHSVRNYTSCVQQAIDDWPWPHKRCQYQWWQHWSVWTVRWPATGWWVRWDDDGTGPKAEGTCQRRLSLWTGQNLQWQSVESDVTALIKLTQIWNCQVTILTTLLL